MVAKYNAKPNPAKRKPGAPLSDAEKKQIDELLALGRTHRQICDEVGIGTSTLSKYKKDTGKTTTPRHDNSAGTQAFKRDAAARRAYRQQAFDELFQSRAETIRKVLAGQEKYKTLVKIPGGGEITEALSYIPAADLRAEIGVLTQIDTSINRNDDRADDGGLARAQSMLQAVLLGIQARGVEVPTEQGSLE